MASENIDKIKNLVSNCVRDKKTHLSLRNLGLNDEDMPQLAQSLNENPSITSVSLVRNNVGNGIAALAGCKYLEEFSSEQNDLGDNGVIALASSGIERLHLNGCNITGKAAQALLDRQCPNSLVSLIFCDDAPKELVIAIEERNKVYKTKEQREAPKKGLCETVMSFWPTKNGSVSGSSEATSRKGFDKK